LWKNEQYNLSLSAIAKTPNVYACFVTLATSLGRLRWTITVETARRYRVVVTYQTPSAARKMEFAAGKQRLLTTLATNGLALRQTQGMPIGEITVEAGSAAWIEITPPQPFFKGDKLGVTDRVELLPFY
jgi:hypothetical protein